MARSVPSNSEFDADLARLGSVDEVAGLRRGVEAALAVAPGSTLNPTDYPILGHYFTSSAEVFLAYFVTPGRFIRYEVFDGRSLTVTVPLDRVSRVVEEAGASDLAVTIELDADAVSTLFEAQSEGQPGTPNSLVRGVARQSRTVYVIQAADLEDMIRLAAFSRAVRSSVGL